MSAAHQIGVLPDADGRSFGWREPSSKERARTDARFSVRIAPPLALRPSIDLRAQCPPVYTQSPFSACTANAVAAMAHYHRIRQGLTDLGVPSRLFVYWYTRVLGGNTGSDDGGTVGDAIQALTAHGYCTETAWPYDRPHLLIPPSPAADGAALKHRSAQPQPLSDIAEVKAALTSSQPVAFGLYIYNSFFSADLNGGHVPMPDTSQPCQAHAGLLVGYSEVSQTLIMRNSWGVHTASGRPCGDNGDYYLPFAYLNGVLATDFWTIASVADSP